MGMSHLNYLVPKAQSQTSAAEHLDYLENSDKIMQFGRAVSRRGWGVYPFTETGKALTVGSNARNSLGGTNFSLATWPPPEQYARRSAGHNQQLAEAEDIVTIRLGGQNRLQRIQLLEDQKMRTFTKLAES